MTSREETQPESSRNAKIKDLLIDIKQTFGIGFGEIAEKVGISASHISGVLNDKRDGGLQLEKSLLLLREVIELRNQLSHAPRDFVKELEVMRGRLDEMERSLTRYPEHKPGAFAMNEKKEPASEGSSSGLGDSAAMNVTKMVVEDVKTHNPGKEKKS